MKKNIILLIAFVVLAAASWYLIGKKSGNSSNADAFAYREFALEDLSKLDKVVLAKRNAEPLIFERNGGHWTINGEYKARKNAMDNMLDVIKNIQIDYVPPNAAIENIMKSFLRHGIKVELYGKNDKPLKNYYVGSSPANGVGTYFVMEGYSKPIVMSLPSMRGNVHTRFNYTLEEWRDMTIIDLKANEIESIELSYPYNKKFSFRIDGKDLTPLHPLQKRISGQPNLKMLNTYLSAFENKKAEYIENKNPRKDSIIAQVPFCELRIVTKAKETKELRFFYLINEEFNNTQIGDMDTYNPIHAERFFVQTSWGDFYLAQQQIFKDIFWKYDFFFEE